MDKISQSHILNHNSFVYVPYFDNGTFYLFHFLNLVHFVLRQMLIILIIAIIWFLTIANIRCGKSDYIKDSWKNQFCSYQNLTRKDSHIVSNTKNFYTTISPMYTVKEYTNDDFQFQIFI